MKLNQLQEAKTAQRQHEIESLIKGTEKAIQTRIDTIVLLAEIHEATHTTDWTHSLVAQACRNVEGREVDGVNFIRKIKSAKHNIENWKQTDDPFIGLSHSAVLAVLRELYKLI